MRTTDSRLTTSFFKGLLIAAMFSSAACSTPGATPLAQQLPDSTYRVLDAVMPELRSIVATSWGAESGSTDSSQITVSFRARIENPHPLAIEPFVLDTAWLAKWKAKGAIAEVCTQPRPFPCPGGAHTMGAQIVALHTFGDSATLSIEVYRAPDFMSGWEVRLERKGESWHLRSKEMHYIT